MKNLILGYGCMMIILYTLLFSLGIHESRIRQTEMEDSLSQVLYANMRHGAAATDDLIRSQVISDLKNTLNQCSDLQITIDLCDMKTGILSATVSDRIPLPFGQSKVYSCHKTIIRDRTEEEEKVYWGPFME